MRCRLLNLPLCQNDAHPSSNSSLPLYLNRNEESDVRCTVSIIYESKKMGEERMERKGGHSESLGILRLMKEQ